MAAVIVRNHCKSVCMLLTIISILYVCFLSTNSYLNIKNRVFLTKGTWEFDFTTGLTFQCSNGGLGNRMFFYAVVYGLSRLNNRNGYSQKCNLNTCQFGEETCVLDSLDKVFELSLPIGPDLPIGEWRGHSIERHLRFPEDYHIPPEANILVGAPHPNSGTHFFHVREEIRREFRFQKTFQEHALSILQQARGSRKNVTFVGVHVRRGDFLPHLKKYGIPLVPQKFFEYALAYFRNIIPNVLFIVLSDDLDWCRRKFVGNDIYVASKMWSAGEDLAVLGNCHHVIFDYGTYGFWAAFLAGGKAMYFVDGIPGAARYGTDVSKKTYPPDWIGVSNAMLELLNKTKIDLFVI